jgi:hypothetical protein
MLTIVACILSGIVVLGFYGYVFSHLYSEYRKMKRQEKHLAEHLSRVGPPSRSNDRPSDKSQSGRFPGSFRAEALVNVGVAVGGLVALVAELEILSRLASVSN